MFLSRVQNYIAERLAKSLGPENAQMAATAGTEIVRQAMIESIKDVEAITARMRVYIEKSAAQYYIAALAEHIQTDIDKAADRKLRGMQALWVMLTPEQFDKMQRLLKE